MSVSCRRQTEEWFVRLMLASRPFLSLMTCTRARLGGNGRTGRYKEIVVHGNRSVGDAILKVKNEKPTGYSDPLLDDPLLDGRLQRLLCTE
jgi:hypothetical protein